METTARRRLWQSLPFHRHALTHPLVSTCRPQIKDNTCISLRRRRRRRRQFGKVATNLCLQTCTTLNPLNTVILHFLLVGTIISSHGYMLSKVDMARISQHPPSTLIKLLLRPCCRHLLFLTPRQVNNASQKYFRELRMVCTR